MDLAAQSAVVVQRSHLDCAPGLGVFCRPAGPAVPDVPREFGSTSSNEGMGAVHALVALGGVASSSSSSSVLSIRVCYLLEFIIYYY